MLNKLQRIRLPGMPMELRVPFFELKHGIRIPVFEDIVECVAERRTEGEGLKEETEFFQINSPRQCSFDGAPEIDLPEEWSSATDVLYRVTYPAEFYVSTRRMGLKVGDEELFITPPELNHCLVLEEHEAVNEFHPDATGSVRYPGVLTFHDLNFERMANKLAESLLADELGQPDPSKKKSPSNFD